MGIDVDLFIDIEVLDGAIAKQVEIVYDVCPEWGEYRYEDGGYTFLRGGKVLGKLLMEERGRGEVRVRIEGDLDEGSYLGKVIGTLFEWLNNDSALWESYARDRGDLLRVQDYLLEWREGLGVMSQIDYYIALYKETLAWWRERQAK